MNSFFNTKYPTFEKWKLSLFKTENLINNNDNFITRHNCVTQVLIFFVQWKTENKNYKELLDINTINKINSLILPDSNIGNIISLSEFYNFEKDYNKKHNSIIEENNSNDVEILENNEESNELDESEDKDYDNDEESMNDESINKFNKISDNKEICYNIQNILNNFKIDN